MELIGKRKVSSTIFLLIGERKKKTQQRNKKIDTFLRQREANFCHIYLVNWKFLKATLANLVRILSPGQTRNLFSQIFSFPYLFADEEHTFPTESSSTALPSPRVFASSFLRFDPFSATTTYLHFILHA